MWEGRYATEPLNGDTVVALLDGCERGDDQFIAEFYRRYHSDLTAFARRRGADDPEGVADLAIFETIRRLPDLRQRDESSVRAYLYRTARNRVIDERRGSKLEAFSLDETGWADMSRPVDPSSTDIGFESEVADRDQFKSLLTGLTEAQREVIVHRFVGGYSSDETARRVGRSTAAVRRLQHDALTRLRLVLAAAAVLALAAGMALWLTSSQGRISVLETEPAERSGPGIDQIGDGGDPALIADTAPVNADESGTESSLVGQRPASTAAPYRAQDDQTTVVAATPGQATTPASTAPLNTPTSSRSNTTRATTTSPTSAPPTTTRATITAPTTARPTTTRPSTTVTTAPPASSAPTTALPWRNPSLAAPSTFQEHLEVELIAANNCLGRSSMSYIGLPNSIFNLPSADLAYVAAVEACNTETNLGQVFAQNDQWQRNLTPDEMVLLNTAMSLVHGCVVGLGWDVGPLAANDNGALYFTRFPADAWNDPQARGFFDSLEACGWFDLPLG